MYRHLSCCCEELCDKDKSLVVSVNDLSEDLKLRGIALEVEARVPEGSPCDHYEFANAPCNVSTKGKAPSTPRLQKESTSTAGTPKMVLLFKTAEGSKEVTVRTRPLELSFHGRVPVVVERAEGHSKELGIQAGWELERLDGDPVEDDFDAFFQKFLQRMRLLPHHYVLPLLFRKPDGLEVTLQLHERPVGMTFDALMPIVVRHVFGHGQDIGVQIGWTLLRFGSKDVSDFGSFDEFFTSFANHLAPLQDSRPCFV